MQAKPKIVRLFVVALITSLVITACGGGTTGATWFNLPSIPVTILENGQVKLFGFAVFALDPAMLQQLRAANVQKLEVRIGYNGIHAYANGSDLPYLSWDEQSLGTLQELIRKAPGLQNANMIAQALPYLRQIGLGVTLYLPPSAGIAASDAAGWRWHGETSATTTEPPATPSIGPFQIGGVAFDDQGNLKIGQVPASALGMSGPLLDANTLGMLKQFGLDKLQIKTDPNGIRLTMNDQPLPGITFDAKSLDQVKPLAGAFAPDLAPMLDSLLPKLPGAQLDVAVSFTGEPAGGIALGAIPVVINADGTLSAFGLPLGANPMVPADVVQKLQQANVQTLNVEVGQDGLFLAANGQTLPTITWTPETMNTLAGIVAPLAGISPDMINSGMSLIKETGAIKASVALAPAGGAAPEAPAEINKTMTPPDMTGKQAPVLHLNTLYQNGALQSVGGLGAGDMPGLPIALPANIGQILGGLNAKQLQIATDPNKLSINLDGNTALTLNYDDASLKAVMGLAGPFLAGTPLADPALSGLIQEQILPLVPGADLDITVNMQ